MPLHSSLDDGKRPCLKKKKKKKEKKKKIHFLKTKVKKKRKKERKEKIYTFF